jgi:hypothetical protein
MRIYIIHYNQAKKRFILHTPGYEETKLIDNLILKDAVFFVAPSCADIIRNRAKEMEASFAKFPHAFAIATECEETMDKAEDTSLVWKDFEYDVFRHDAFVLVDTQEPITKQVKYLMLREGELKVVL